MIEYLLILFFSGLLIYQILCHESREGFDVSDMALRNHDEIVNLKATLDTQYKPLIQNSQGQPSDILTRLAILESDVQGLTDNAMNQQQNSVESVPEAPDLTQT